MPGITPRFGIRYPCYGDAVNDTFYQNFANDVDAALTTIDALKQAVQRPPTVKAVRPSGQNINVATDTNVTFTSALWDNAAFWNAGAPTDLTIPSTGIYYVTARTDAIGNFTTCTSTRLTMLLGGAATLPDNKINQSFPTNAFGIFKATAGQIVTMRMRWTGTGGPALMSGIECVLYKVCSA